MSVVRYFVDLVDRAGFTADRVERFKRAAASALDRDVPFCICSDQGADMFRLYVDTDMLDAGEPGR